MAAYLIPQPQQFFDNNGDPLAGGLVYTCSAGASGITSEYLKDSYTDALGTTLNSNPVVLDSSGRANIWGDGLPYKLFIYTASMALVESVDNLSPILGVAPNITVDSISSLGNLADNADFQIWTRGDSVTIANNASQICSDRYWLSNFNDAGATATMAKDVMLVDGVSQTCGKVSTSTAVSSYASGKYIIPFFQVFEGRSAYRYLSPGKSFVVAVAIEVSIAGKYAFAVRNADASYSYIHTVVLASNTPTIVQFSIAIPTSSGIWNCPNTAARGFDLVIGAIGNSQYAAPSTDGWVSGNYFTAADCVNWTATAGATIKVTRVRLEEGAVLGAYQAKTYDEDEARCRYFLPMYEGLSLPTTSSNASNVAFITIQHIPPARVAPMGVLLPSTNSPIYLTPQGDQITSFVINAASKGSTLLKATPSTSITPGYAQLAFFGNNTPGKIIFTGAEL